MPRFTIRKIVVAGGSIAGLSAARELRRCGYDGQLQVIDAEDRQPYYRPELSKGVLTGQVAGDRVRGIWPDGLEVEHITGVRLQALDIVGRSVTGAHPCGPPEVFPFDGLVIATGSRARRIPQEFRSLSGIYTLRDLSDALAIRSALLGAKKLVISGGGFLGLEVAAAARALDIEVTIVEARGSLLEPFGAEFGQRMLAMHRQRGVEVRLGETVVEVEGEGCLKSVVSSSGARLDADVLLVATGAVPASSWLRASGIGVADGVDCDRHCQVRGVEGIVAAGDIASWYNPLYAAKMRVEHWAHAIQQGTAAARTILGSAHSDGFAVPPYFWSDQYGLRLHCIGRVVGHDQVVALQADVEDWVYAFGRQGRLVAVAGLDGGAVLAQRSRIIGRASLNGL